MPIEVTASDSPITVSASGVKIDANVTGGQGPQGPAGSADLPAGDEGDVLTYTGGSWVAAAPASGYTLPTASASTLGGVKIGSGISIDGSGVISASAGYTLPTATGSVLGGVKIGAGVTITDGVISVSTNYAAASHTHAISDVTGLQTALDGKQVAGSYAAAVHTHGISDVTGLQTALDGKAATSHSHAISDVTGLQTALDGKQASGSYAAATHSHAIGDVTGLQTALDGKASLSHAHSVADVSAGSTAGLVIVTTTGGVLSALSQGTAGQALVVNSTATGVEWGTVTQPTYDVRTDTVSSTAYTGRAVSGSATSASVWKIRRTIYSSAGAVSSTATATNVKWDDRLTASYS